MRKSLRLGLLVSALALVGALGAPYLIDSGSLRTTLAEQLSTALGQTVAVERLQVKFVPTASVRLTNVQTAFDDRPESVLKVGRIHMELSWRALLRGKLAVRRLSIETLDLNPVLLVHLRRFGGDPEAATAHQGLNIPLQDVQLSGVTWTADGDRRFGPFTATLTWDKGLRPNRIDIAQEDGRLRALLLQNPDGIEVRVAAKDWIVPLDRPIELSRLQIRGLYRDNGIEIFQARLQLPDGGLRFSGPITWDTHWRIDANLNAERVNLSTLLPALGLPTFPGRIEGECSLSAEAPGLAALLRRPGLDCQLAYSQGETTSNLTIKTVPANDGVTYTLGARNLLMPIGPPMYFEMLEAQGWLDAKHLQIQTARIEGYGGNLESQGTLTWDPQWQINVDARSESIRLAPLLKVFQKRSLDGKLESRCTGTFKAAELSALLGRPDMQCDFNILEGEIYDADLERAANLLKTGSSGSGSTPFDRLRGQLQLKGDAARFSGLQLHSTVLEATGNLTVDAQDNLAGELSVGLKNTAGVVSVPLLVEGTVGAPLIRPTTSAMAGGAAGTLLLGPGLGTAVGVKMGEALQKARGWFKSQGNRNAPEAAADD